MFVFFLTKIIQTINLKNEHFLYKYKPYCEAIYKNIPQKNNFKLKKLIVIHRHGDRTPLKNYGMINEKCINCQILKSKNDFYNISNCYIDNCKDGMLTIKGYNQMINLGKFIKREYFNKIRIRKDDIYLRATSVKRTNVSLNGVISGFYSENDEIYLNQDYQDYQDSGSEDKVGGSSENENNSQSIDKNIESIDNGTDKNIENGNYKNIENNIENGTENNSKNNSENNIENGTDKINIENNTITIKENENENNTIIENNTKNLNNSFFGENFTFQIFPPKEDTLIGYKTCPRLTHIMTLTSKKAFQNDQKIKDLQNISDYFLYSMCKNNEINCNLFSCDKNYFFKIIDGNFKTWTYQSILLKNHKKIMKFMFGKFAIDLLNAFRSKNKLSFFSAHDNSLSYILAGLNTKIIERPPLASAIFLEVWSFNNIKYVRIIFNNFVCLTDIDKSTNIPYEKFIRYLESVKSTDEELINECNEI